ncbi:MAG: glycosyltransferase family 9 protein [Verrucomicrobiota bacterium]|jgi:ADP-heptose:LPS heptosyltransferase
MNIPKLQTIDRVVGVPLCFFLTCLRRVLPRRLPPGRAPVRNLLFVKLAEQGSTVLAIAAINRAAEMVGRENVYFIAFEENRFILDLLELIPEKNVITLNSQSLTGLAFTTLKAMRRMWALSLDAAIDMEFFARGSAVLAFLSGARARVGFHTWYAAGPYRGDLFTHRLLYNPHLHTTTTFQVLVEALRMDPADLPTIDLAPPSAENTFAHFVPRPGEVAPVEAMLPRQNGKRPPVILLNPNAGDLVPLRQWPAGRYVELARRLLAQFPEVHISFTGGPREVAPIERLAREVNSPRCTCLAGKTTLRQLMALYALCEVLVTNDSGPAHFASLTSIHVVTLFGPETPALFAARTPRNVAIWAGLSCSPCVNANNNRQSPCLNNLCMQQITVDQVFGEVCRIYRERRAAIPAR